MSKQITKLLQNSLVILIISLAIISWFGKSTYDNYITRQKIAEGFLIVTAIQNQLNEYATAHSGFPAASQLDNTSFSLPNPFEIKGTYISSVSATKPKGSMDVVLIATLNTLIIPNLENGDAHLLSNPHLRFVGHFSGTQIIWVCSSDLAQRYLPDNCSGT